MKKIVISLVLVMLSVWGIAQTSPQWVARHYGNSHTDDYGRDITIDAAGNTYVLAQTSTGSAASTPDFIDYCVIKYDAAGDTVWVRYYDSPNTGYPYEDRPVALEVDNSGNVYVTGNSEAPGVGSLTIKYDVNGDTVWTRNANLAYVYNMTIDAAGNIFLAGSSYHLGGWYFTIYKYDPSGTLQWLKWYGALGASFYYNFYASSVATDGNSIYATGLNQTNFYTLKLQSNGDTLWTNNQGAGQGNSVAYDATGNTYATGYSYSGATGVRYLTVKYDNAGDTLWVRDYTASGNSSQAVALAVDASANAYVTGLTAVSSTSDASDYVTIKYNAVGDTVWLRKYDNGARDAATCLGIDNMGNVYVSGYSENSTSTNAEDYLTIKYNSLGDTVWTRRFNDAANRPDVVNAMIVDAAGNVYITGYSTNAGNSAATVDKDACTIKYNTAGVQQWQKFYDKIPGYSSDVIYDFTTDNAGFIYATGTSSGRTDYDYCTVKFNALGDTVWARHQDGGYGNLGAGNDYARAIIVDNAGSVYVTGSGSGSGAVKTFKYDALGNIVWSQIYPVTSSGGYDIAFGDSGSVYVTGTREFAQSDYDFFTIKYDTNGVQKWTRTWSSGSFGNAYIDRAELVATDNAGNVYVSGKCVGGTNEGWVTIKYSGNGDTLWTKQNLSASTMSDSYPVAMASDGGNFLYVFGGAKSPSAQHVAFCTIKYNAVTGDTVWVRKFPVNTGLNSSDLPVDMALDNAGNVYVTGRYLTINNGFNYRTVKYNALGDTAWVRTYSSQGNNQDNPDDIKVDANGNVFISGRISNDDSLAVLKYDTNGNQLWLITYPVNTSGTVGPCLINLTNTGEVVLATSFESVLHGLDYCVLRYTQPVGMETLSPNKNSAVIAYPNPADNEINFILPDDYHSEEIIFYDTQGRKLGYPHRSKIRNFQHQISIDVSQLTSGIYFYSFVYPEGKSVKGKIIIQ